MILKGNNLHILIQILYINLILPIIFALSGLNEKCYVESEKKYGVCVNKSNCKMLNSQKGRANYYPDLCESSSDIQCCIKTVTTLRNGEELTSEGLCQNIKDCPENSNTRYTDECPGSNDIKLCVPNEYLFAVGFREIIYVNNIKNGEYDRLHKIDISLSEKSWEFSKFKDTLLKELEKDGEYYYEHIDVIIVKHAGLYIGTQLKGRIFEFDSNGWGWSEYEMGIERFQKIPDDKNDWNWISLDLTGYTYVSPESIEQSLKEYREKYNYFKNDSFHYICNNSFEFVYWCLNILNNKDNGNRLVGNYTLDTHYNSYQFKSNLKKNIKSMTLLYTLNNIKNDQLLDEHFELYPALLSYISGSNQPNIDYFNKMFNIRKNNFICVPYVGKAITINDIRTTDSEILSELYSELEEKVILLINEIAFDVVMKSGVPVTLFIADIILYFFDICHSSRSNKETKNSISNIFEALAHYRAQSGLTVPANQCLINDLKSKSDFINMKEELKNTIKTKITDDKIMKKSKIKASEGSRRGLWYLTLGHYSVDINYEFIPKYGRNSFNINYSGYDTWDFEHVKIPNNLSVFEKLKLYVHNFLEDIFSLCAGEGKPFNITYNFDDEMSIDYEKKSKRSLLYDDNSFMSSENSDTILNNSCNIPEDPFINIVELVYNKYLEEQNNNNSISDESTINRCGPKYDKCPSGQCCNKNGKCGTKATFCSKQKGCQPKYGKCKNIVIITKKKIVTKVVKATKKKKN